MTHQHHINEFTEYIIIVLPYIFSGKIPDDILSKKEAGMLSASYYLKITKFLDKCGHQQSNGNDLWRGSDNTPSEFQFWPALIKKALENKGYVRRPEEY